MQLLKNINKDQQRMMNGGRKTAFSKRESLRVHNSTEISNKNGSRNAIMAKS